MQDGAHAERIHLRMLSAAAIVRSWEQLSLFLATDFSLAALDWAPLVLIALSQQSGRGGQQDSTGSGPDPCKPKQVVTKG